MILYIRTYQLKAYRNLKKREWHNSHWTIPSIFLSVLCKVLNYIKISFRVKILPGLSIPGILLPFDLRIRIDLIFRDRPYPHMIVGRLYHIRT